MKVLKSCTMIFAAGFFLLEGCKIEITVPEGGRVVTQSGTYACESGKTCVIDVVDLFFDETFTGQPEEGYGFSHWVKKPRGLCGGKTTPCPIETSGFGGNEVLLAFLESEEVFLLEPVFVHDLAGTTFNGLSSQLMPVALTVSDNAVTHMKFTYQQLGEIPPDPDCRHPISVDLSAPIDTDGTFAVDVSVPPQTSDSGKLQVVAFDGQLSGSVDNSEATGRWDFTEMEILCEKSNGQTLRNFCGERFLPCIDAVDFRFVAR